eukprot:TRINITY_DN2529_c0_g1_i1.p1 TRINITY_DN2529_c0_g1~~TRINITY_DN2529_c0_g1_i1.p1  ORF type:complete len:188 (+),score=15.99 TRINITY_DN2529_c0_g1_i1:74-637(+)
MAVTHHHAYDIKKPQWLVAIFLYIAGFAIAIAGISILQHEDRVDDGSSIFWYSIFWSFLLVLATLITSIINRHMTHVLLALFAAELAVSTIVTYWTLTWVETDPSDSGRMHAGYSCAFAGFLIKTLAEMLMVIFMIIVILLFLHPFFLSIVQFLLPTLLLWNQQEQFFNEDLQVRFLLSLFVAVLQQ